MVMDLFFTPKKLYLGRTWPYTFDYKSVDSFLITRQLCFARRVKLKILRILKPMSPFHLGLHIFLGYPIDFLFIFPLTPAKLYHQSLNFLA